MKFVAEVACLDPQLSLNEITREEYSEEKKIKSGWGALKMRGSRKFTCLWVSVPVLWGRRWSSWRGPSNSSVGTFLPQPGDNPFRPHQWCLQALLSLDKCDYFWHSNLKCQSRFNSKNSYMSLLTWSIGWRWIDDGLFGQSTVSSQFRIGLNRLVDCSLQIDFGLGSFSNCLAIRFDVNDCTSNNDRPWRSRLLIMAVSVRIWKKTFQSTAIY